MPVKKNTNQKLSGGKAKNAARGTTAKKSTAKNKAKAPVKPKIRINRAHIGLPSGEGVVDLKNINQVKLPASDVEKNLSVGKKSYGSEAYDEDLENGDDQFQEDLLDKPVESLGELLDDDEKLHYEDEMVAKTVTAKIKQAREQSPEAIGNGRIYRKLAIGFIAVVVVFLLVSAYFVLVKMKINLVLKNEAVTGELDLYIYNNAPADNIGLPENAIKGLVRKITLEKTQNFTVSGSEVIGEEVSGTMTVYNKYVKNQPLVATTRLLSSSGILFRLKNSVNVPAGGQLEVEVYADDPRVAMQIGNERFAIPGLWEGLQDKVYAESKSGGITFKQKVKQIVSQEDIDRAVSSIKDGLLAEAKTQIDNSYGDFKQQLYQLDESSIIIENNALVGEEKNQITLKIKAVVVAVAFNDDMVLELVSDKALSSLSAGKELTDIAASDLSYELKTVVNGENEAEVKALFVGQAKIISLDDFLDRRKLTGLSVEQLRAYLKNIPEIESYDIAFYPPFLKKSPALVDRIEIVLSPNR